MKLQVGDAGDNQLDDLFEFSQYEGQALLDAYQEHIARIMKATSVQLDGTGVCKTCSQREHMNEGELKERAKATAAPAAQGQPAPTASSRQGEADTQLAEALAALAEAGRQNQQLEDQLEYQTRRLEAEKQQVEARLQAEVSRLRNANRELRQQNQQWLERAQKAPKQLRAAEEEEQRKHGETRGYHLGHTARIRQEMPIELPKEHPAHPVQRARPVGIAAANSCFLGSGPYDWRPAMEYGGGANSDFLAHPALKHQFDPAMEPYF